MTRVAIIGGGPSGLIVARALSLEPHAFHIDVFERRDRTGGVWFYDKDIRTEGYTPMYKYLETNLDSRLMLFKDEKPLEYIYQRRDEVRDYLDEFRRIIEQNRSNELREKSGESSSSDATNINSIANSTNNSVFNPINFKLNSNIVNVEKKDQKWIVATPSKSESYDAVIVANGHFNRPYTPEVPGLEEWKKKDPSSIVHAADYNDPADFNGKTVLIVGYKSSGLDISTQVAVSAKKVYVSSLEPPESTDLKTHIPRVSSYDYGNKSVTLTDGSVINDIDSVLFCTGYLYDFPFLAIPDVVSNKMMVQNIYKQIFYIKDPTLAFVGLCQNVAPFPLVESQAGLISRVYGGRFHLPNADEMKKDYENELNLHNGKLHDFTYPRDVEYGQEIQEMYKDLKGGFEPESWSEEKLYLRLQSVDSKLARQKVLEDHVRVLRKNGEPFRLLPQEKYN